MARCRVGVHGRNDVRFYDADYEVLRVAKIETLKMMSHTDVDVYRRAREINPNVEFIVRLFMPEHQNLMKDGRRITPQEFVAYMAPIINRLRPWVKKFEIHNEPNHHTGLEGWGATDDHARDFLQWYLEVLRRLRQVAPWAQFGFPGLAPGDYPHRDRAWLAICRPAIEQSDWLGVHCYWQYDNMRHPEWGLRFRLYHDMFPNKPLEITEFGDSTNVSPEGTFRALKADDHIAQEYADYYTLLLNYDYVRSASAFILSSPDPQWRPFVWRLESGRILPVAYAVGNVSRQRPQPVAVWKTEWVQVKIPGQIPLGVGTTCSFTLRNAGTETWKNTGPNRVRLGYHWYDAQGRPVPADQDIRAELPRPVGPGETVVIKDVRVVPPPWPGRYTLEWDLVEEGKAWFVSRGSPPYRVNVEVVLTPDSKRTFPETGKTVEQPFLAFFYQYGLDITGYPITDVIVENGMRTQYWQRLAMEEPEPGKVRLKLIGQELLDLRAKVRDLLKRLESGGVLPPVSPPAIVDVVDQLPRDPEGMIKRSLDEIRYVVFDHTAIEGQVSLERIARAHRERLPGIPYHYYIDLDGTIYQTEPLEDVVTRREDHLYGIRVGVAGNFSKTVPNEAQMEAAAHLTAWLLRRFHLTTDAVKGTSEFVVTESPGKNWLEGKKWKHMLLERVKQRLEGTLPPETGIDAGEIDAVLDTLRRELEEQRQLRDALMQQLQTQQAANKALRDELARAHEQMGQLQAALDRLQALLRSLPAGGEPGSQRVEKPPIQDIIDALPKNPEESYPTRSLSAITHITIHHSAAPANLDVERIAKWHVEHHGWPGIGYHFYITPDGTIYQTNHLTTMSNHVYMNNAYTVGICVAGNFDTALPTPAQIDAAARLVAWLTQELKIPLENVKGHKEYPRNTTRCPGLKWLEEERWKDILLARVRQVLRGEVDVSASKPIFHYMLFWQKADSWARQDWLNSINYVARYRPTMGFSHDDAMHAQRVTIVGGPLGVSEEIEQKLIDAGCRVRRVAGTNEAETKALLDKLAEEGDPFLLA